MGYVPEPGGGVESLPETDLTVVVRAPAQGLHESEWLLRDPHAAAGAPNLVLASAACYYSDRCGCRPPRYVVGTAADGQVKVLRLNPHLVERKLLQQGTCTVGSGATMPNEPRGFALPTSDESKVEVIEVPYEADLVQVECEVSEPAP